MLHDEHDRLAHGSTYYFSLQYNFRQIVVGFGAPELVMRNPMRIGEIIRSCTTVFHYSIVTWFELVTPERVI